MSHQKQIKAKSSNTLLRGEQLFRVVRIQRILSNSNQAKEAGLQPILARVWVNFNPSWVSRMWLDFGRINQSSGLSRLFNGKILCHSHFHISSPPTKIVSAGPSSSFNIASLTDEVDVHELINPLNQDRKPRKSTRIRIKNNIYAPENLLISTN